jgi:RHS repeat-associated protein
MTVDNAGAGVWKEFTVAGIRASGGPGGTDAIATGVRKAWVPKTPEAFSYDADGNLTGDGRWTYTWDGENRLVAMQTRSDILPPVGHFPLSEYRKLEFGYDLQGRRFSKKVSNWTGSGWQLASSTLFLYDGWNLIAELNVMTAKTPIRTYVWGLDLSGSLQGAGGVGGLLFTNNQSPNTGTYASMFDGNGNVIAYADLITGAKSANYEYSVFGEPLILEGVAHDQLPFRFSTKYTDSESSLIYYGLRYYSHNTGRWLSRDPLQEAGSDNFYAMVANQPVSRVDVLGLLSLDEIQQKYRDMITSARSKGKNVAADNLEYFLSAAGGVRVLDWRWLRGFDSVIDAEKANQDRFLGETIKKAARNGSAGTILDWWDSTQTASRFSELYYASGTFTVTSYGKFEVSCEKDGKINFKGIVDHFWWDPYDWHLGLAAYIPGFGVISDEDAVKLESAGRAASFQMQSEWTQTVEGSYDYNKFWFDASEANWSEPSGGSSGVHAEVVAKYPKAERPQ